MSDLSARYGRPSRVGRGALLVTIGLVAGLFLSWLLWTAWERANPPVAGRVQAFDVVDDHAVKATLRVDRRDPSLPVTCTLAAQAVSFERVAELSVPVPPGTERLTDVDVTLKTLRRATTVTLDQCLPAQK